MVFQPLVGGDGQQGLGVTQILRDTAPARQVYEPAHPDADPATGLVAYPNVDVASEMTDMLSASRAYEANATVLNAVKQMAQKALELGRA